MRHMTASELVSCRVSKLVSLLALGAQLVGCAPGEAWLSDEETSEELEQLKAPRKLLLCEQGLSDRTSGWDKGLFALCEATEAFGFKVIRDGEYPAFGALDEKGAYNALFDELDENGDGLVDANDSPALVHVVGFSWGGINITDVADRLRVDKRVAVGRRGVTAMVLLDPFQPQLSRANIPSNVAHAWIYRQTETTDGDCSSSVSLGFGYNGHRPRAQSEMTFCQDYDLDAFKNDVGHCDVPSVATKAAVHNLVTLTDYEPWAKNAVECDLD